MDDFRNVLTDMLFRNQQQPSIAGYQKQQLLDYFNNPDMANQLSQQDIAPYFNTNAPSTRYALFANSLNSQQPTAPKVEPEVRMPAVQEKTRHIQPNYIIEDGGRTTPIYDPNKPNYESNVPVGTNNGVAHYWLKNGIPTASTESFQYAFPY